MWQAIAEVVKQGMRNLANSGKNAQSNGQAVSGGVSMANPQTNKIGSNESGTEAQQTQDTTKTETVKQEEPVETGESSSSGGGMGGMSMPSLGDKGDSSTPSVGGGDMGGASADMGGGMAMSDKNTKDAKDVSNDKKGKVFESIREHAQKANDGLKSTQVQGSVYNPTPISSTVVSDERLKDIFGEETPIDCFAKIHSYEFKYTPEAQEMMKGKNHVDDKEHLGVMAQELLMNPATSACVIKDTDGFLKVDTAQLTMANTATIAELSRKVQKLEEMLGDR